MLLRLISGAAIAALVAPAAHSQVWLSPGNLVLQGDDASATITLSNPFTMPDGTAVTQLDVDTNGRVFPAGADTPDFSESITELLGGPTSICPYWDDLVVETSGRSGVYFNTIAGLDVITWNDVRQFGGTNLFTMQLQLLPTGNFFVLYDSRVDADEPLVGLSAGIGNADPGSSDYTAGPIATAGNPEVYEDFDLAPFDMQSSFLVFNPDGSGGYNVAWQGGLPDPNFVFGGIETSGLGCPRFAMTAAPSNPGYVVVPTATADQTFLQGQPLGLSDDGESGPLPLGFTFTFPGGSAVTDIEVLANGRVVPANSGELADFTPTLAEFLNDPVPQIAGYWTDMNPGAGGEIYFNAGAGTASITWVDVPQFSGDEPFLFQIRLFADNSFQVLLGDTPLNGASVTAVRDLLIGFTDGNGAVDPGETDLTTMLPVAVPGDTFYEFFDVLGASDIEDLPENMPVLSFSTGPVIGQPLDLEVSNLPSGTLSVGLLIGLPTILDLSNFGIAAPGCTVLSDGLIGVGLPISGSTTGTVSLPLPNDPNLIGVQTVFQSVAIAPMNPPVSVSDAKTVTIGS